MEKKRKIIEIDFYENPYIVDVELDENGDLPDGFEETAMFEN